MVFGQIHPADHNPRRIRKVGKSNGDILDFKDIKFPVKVTDIHEIKRKNSIGISAFCMKIKKISNLCVKKML